MIRLDDQILSLLDRIQSLQGDIFEQLALDRQLKGTCLATFLVLTVWRLEKLNEVSPDGKIAAIEVVVENFAMVLPDGLPTLQAAAIEATIERLRKKE